MCESRAAVPSRSACEHFSFIRDSLFLEERREKKRATSSTQSKTSPSIMTAALDNNEPDVVSDAMSLMGIQVRDDATAPRESETS